MQKVGFIGLGTMGMPMVRGLGNQDLYAVIKVLEDATGLHVGS
jgi:3-hydroxyisobutyrate dehydrogenase-like beta-hydroxyacid dehydrogenase